MTSDPNARTATLLVLALALLVVAAGVLVWIGLHPERHDTLVVGDSVTFLSIEDIQDELGEPNTQIVARPGWRSVDLVHSLRHVLRDDTGPAKSRDVAIFLVGYNDVSRKTEGQPSLPAMVKASNAFRCAVWLTLPARPGGEPGPNPKFRAEAVDLWNRRMQDLVAEQEHAHLATEWQDAVEAPGHRDLVQADGLHPTKAGRRQLARSMADAVGHYC